MKKVLQTILILFFLGMFLVSGYFIFDYFWQSAKQELLYSSLTDVIEEAQNKQVSSAESEEDPMLDALAELSKQNDDLVGWIRMEDTNVNYPVVQSIDEPNFYLHHDFEKNEANFGCPYLQENCDIDKPSDNLVVYGHHMKDGSMFADLEKYSDEEFFKAHPTFDFYTLTKGYTYEIIAVFKTTATVGDDSAFYYHEFVDAASPEDFDEYVSTCKAHSLYDTGVTASYGDTLLTLSTCDYTRTNGRMVVVAKRTAS